MPRVHAAEVNATHPGSHGALAARRRNASADWDRFEPGSLETLEVMWRWSLPSTNEP
jgi:hypothetical protein